MLYWEIHLAQGRVVWTFLLTDPSVTSRKYIPTYKNTLQVPWDTIVPILVHAAIYCLVSILRKTSRNALSCQTVHIGYCVQGCLDYFLLWYTLSWFWVVFGEICMVRAHILPVVLFTMNLYMGSLFALGNTFQVTWYCVSVTSLILNICFWAGCVHLRLLSHILSSKFIWNIAVISHNLTLYIPN